jgi:hypothetical protein
VDKVVNNPQSVFHRLQTVKSGNESSDEDEFLSVVMRSKSDLNCNQTLKQDAGQGEQSFEEIIGNEHCYEVEKYTDQSTCTVLQELQYHGIDNNNDPGNPFGPLQAVKSIEELTRIFERILAQSQDSCESPWRFTYIDPKLNNLEMTVHKTGHDQLIVSVNSPQSREILLKPILDELKKRLVSRGWISQIRHSDEQLHTAFIESVHR